jgi:hypothetical protein
MRIPRTRGALSGVLLVLLGLWGGLVPFVGPSFDFGFTPDRSWHMTDGRLYLSLLPAIATVVGGLLLLLSAHRARAALGAWLAMAGGAWFVAGRDVSRLWNDGRPELGAPIDGGGGTLEHLAYFSGLGALVVALGAFALGRLAVRAVRDVELEREAAAEAAAADAAAAEPRRRTGRFDRDPGRDPEPAASDGDPARPAGPAGDTAPTRVVEPDPAPPAAPRGTGRLPGRLRDR